MVAAAAVVAVEGVSAAAAAGVSAEAAGVPAGAAAVEISAGDHQVVVHREEAVMGAYGTQAAGLRRPEATVEAAAVAALIVEAGQERGIGAAVRRHAAGVRMLAEKLKAGARIVAQKRKAGVRILVKRRKADGRTHGQRKWTHAQIVSTSVAMI